MITTINEFKNINENYETVGAQFSLSFKISIPQTQGRIVYPNITPWNIHFELIDISNYDEEPGYDAYTYAFRTNISNKYAKPKRKDEIFRNNFTDRLYNLLNGWSACKTIFDEDKFDGKFIIIKHKK